MDHEPRPPLPPADLAARALSISVLDAGAVLHRLHFRTRGALFFGPVTGAPASGRFDAPDGAFRTCYLGMTLAGCFAEKLCRRLGQRVIEWSLIDELDEALIEVRRPLRVVELNGPGLAALGATAAVASGPYRVSRAWARALHGHPDAPDGIRYRSRHDDSERCVGLFDRCRRRLRHTMSQPLAVDRDRMLEMIRRYRLALVD